MAMVKPIALTKNAFDATNNEVFSFTSSGGNQIVKNKITIRKNSDNSIIYTNTQETFAFNQIVPSGALTNGEYYNYFFNTYDVNNNESPASNIVPFYCYTQPTLTFTNISNNDTIESSNYLFTIEYNQIQGELLDGLKFVLYDINGSVLSESTTLYSTNTPPIQLSYSFDGMGNNTSYQIQVIGSTINGTLIASSKLTFEVRYENPAVYTKLDLENKCNDGYVQIRSNLIFIDGESNPIPPTYIEDKAVDLSNIESWVQWMEGYEIPQDFILQIWMNPVLLGEFCRLWNKSSLTNNIKIELSRDIFEGQSDLKDCFVLNGEYNGIQTLVQSNIVGLLNNLSEIIVWIKKVGNIYSLFLDVVSTTPNTMLWNSNIGNNVEYNKITDIRWNSGQRTYVRYSPNADGSGMTETKQSNSRYVGVGYMPKEIYEHENLILDSANIAQNFVISKEDSNRTWSMTEVDTDGQKTLQIEVLTGGTGWTFGQIQRSKLNTTKIVSSSVLTISFDLYITSRFSTDMGYWMPSGTNKIFTWSVTNLQYNTWIPVSITTTKIDGVSDSAQVLYFARDNWLTTPGAITRIKNLKLEQGTEATPWTPAPSDWLADPNNYAWTEITQGTISPFQSQMLMLPIYNNNYFPQTLNVQNYDIMGDINNLFPVDSLRIRNGVFYHINSTKNTSIPYTRVVPSWDYYTILDCDFNHNINAGNVNILLSQLESLKIKRRELGTFDWITLKNIIISSVADLNIVYQDSYVPSFHTFQWALVPVLNGAIEAEYIINETETSFNGVFISNKNAIFKLYNSVGYGGTTRIKNIGIIQTIGNKYPTFINNSIVDYEQGEITATLYGYEFESTRQINPISVVQQTNDLLTFLNDGTAKMITDWNGNIKMVRINPSPTISYNQSYGNRITTVTFQWTEQGVYNNQDDLYYNNLIDVLS